MSPRRPSHGHSRSVFSLKSNRSADSDHGSLAARAPKIAAKELKDVPKDHRTTKFGQSVKNPNFSINEAEPGERAQQETSTLVPLRSLEHKDHLGNTITDADASNPTRHRLERPLDTIRAFEAAIDGSYKRRTQFTRTESADAANLSSRRSSYVGGGYPEPQRGFNGYGNYRLSSSRTGDGHGPMRPSPYRGNTAPMMTNPVHEHEGYPAHSYQDSYDTVNTRESNGSQSTEPWTNSTDPSSENSSVDRIQSAANNKMENDAYGAYGAQYGRGSPRPQPIQEEYSHGGQMYAQEQSYPPHGYPPQSSAQYSPRANGPMGPPPPPANPQQLKKPIRLGGDSFDKGPKPAAPPSNGPKLQKRPSENGKHKSWLRRRFSKG